MSAELSRLVARLRARLNRADGRAGREAVHVQRLLDRIAHDPAPYGANAHPLVRHLPAALAGLERDAPDLAALLGPLAAGLPWRHGYEASAELADLHLNMGWAEFVGPAAPWRSDEVCLGLTLIGPNTHYPAHQHPAVELYHVLTGVAEWSSHWRRPGAFVLHDSNQIHAMRTGDEPLLALYTWSGDVVSPSVWSRQP
ncbi:hypothetical protein GJ654_20120 [Rhodoblastus acidophilus]|uniref:Dimethlysulfonioproprionate lyase n=1 Tax=Rhodoblastus acidophilus TaxID=1074 RepID=A0A6N8DSA2_RHOAC|nr:dimethylsulfonioproprionate lyase family protein [Rhodoblastus acidophilus]MCW2276492.1 hypothetical protein [Rhodoblastus acidophilus]MTV33287.1 hypothetical protein [Rhodoblastus acidophilus]